MMSSTNKHFSLVASNRAVNYNHMDTSPASTLCKQSWNSVRKLATSSWAVRIFAIYPCSERFS
jgi:hypothetical protein